MFTFAAVPSAVVHADCMPVLVEVGENYRLDMHDFEAKFSDGIQAVLIGHTSDMDQIKVLCYAKSVPLIEDAAHSGTGKINTIGKVGCFSFQSYKLVNGGKGDILITNDDLIARCIIMSDAYETNWQKHTIASAAFETYQDTLPLYNTRMSNLSAAVIRPQLAHVKRDKVSPSILHNQFFLHPGKFFDARLD